MTDKELEERVAVLEADVIRLKSKVERLPTPDKPWWEKIAGTFANDPQYEEAMRLGREWRESFRHRARPRKKAKRASNP